MASLQLEMNYARNHISLMLHRPINWLEELPGSWIVLAHEEAWPVNSLSIVRPYTVQGLIALMPLQIFAYSPKF
jgi:hypothetical protein